MKISNEIWLGAMPIFLLVVLFPAPLNAQTAESLVISQIQITGGTGKTNFDYVEIHNPTQQPIDLQGYRLVKRTKTGDSDTLIKSFTESFIIPSMGYFLWANSNYTEIATTPDVTTSQTLAADNAVALRNGPNDLGEIIDSVGWGEAQNALVETTAFAESPGEDQALLRKNNFIDTNNNSVDFEIVSSQPRSSTSLLNSPTDPPVENPVPEAQSGEDGGANTNQENNPPVQNQPPAATAPDYAKIGGAIVINEIVPNPEGVDQGSEWVEFYNKGASKAGLSGWLIDDSGEALGSNAYQLPNTITINAGEYFVVDLPKGSPALNNSGGDCVQLYSPDKIVWQKVCYTESLAEGESIARNAQGSYEITSTITKGLKNSFPIPALQSKQSAVNANIAINELYPNPEGEQDEEFIELINLGSDEIDLTSWEIGDRSRTYKIDNDDFSENEIGPGGLFVLPRTVTRIALNNTGGEKVILSDPAGKEHVVVEYVGSAPKGESFSRTQDGSYVWSMVVTAGKENIIENVGVEENTGEASETEADETEDNPEIYSLSDLRSLPMESRGIVSGVVSATPGTFGDRVMYLSGSGIRVAFASAFNIPKLKLGDKVTLTGILVSSRNELQLAVSGDDILEIINSGEPPKPHSIKTGEVGENTEGYLVRVAGTITRSAGDTFYIDDGSGEARILVMDSTGINKPETRKGNSAIITGIVTQFGDIYRITPRMQEDIEIGGVLGAGLPITGMGISEIILAIILMLILGPKLLKLNLFAKHLP